jgi:hypothetical protein
VRGKRHRNPNLEHWLSNFTSSPSINNDHHKFAIQACTAFEDLEISNILLMLFFGVVVQLGF